MVNNDRNMSAEYNIDVDAHKRNIFDMKSMTTEQE
jgi:hypothetical protein